MSCLKKNIYLKRKNSKELGYLGYLGIVLESPRLKIIILFWQMKHAETFICVRKRSKTPSFFSFC